MAEVFISYRHVSPDQDLAAQLAKYLDERRVSHFVDTEIRIAEEWVKVIDRELRDCHAFVVLLSSDSIRSDAVRYEVKLAHEGKKRMFPIRVAYDGALPLDLGYYLDSIQYKLWYQGDSFAPICGAILDGLHGNWKQDGLEPSADALRRLGEATELRGAPLPYADPRLETGALKLDSPFYVRRPADEAIERLVRQPGETILVKGPRQVGKTSLAARAQAAAQLNSQHTCYIDFQLIDASRYSDFGGLLKYLAARLAKEFDTNLKPRDVWDDMLGDADSLTDFMERGVLAGRDKPVLVCLDEVDNVFNYSYRDSFFGLLRGWHNRRATHTARNWNRFNLLIAHSTEPALFIQDVNQSPFNVGVKLELGDFDRDEILWLNQRHGCPLKGAEDVERVIRLVGGHPYLVRQAFFSLSRDGASVKNLDQTAADDKGPFGDHLRRLLWALRGNDRLRKSLKQVVKSHMCDEEGDFQRLRAAGLIDGESRRSARPRCALYARYLEGHLQ
jgi:hypothetical protein